MLLLYKSKIMSSKADDGRYDLIKIAPYQNYAKMTMVWLLELCAEKRKHLENDAKCKQLGWWCIPLVVETYGAWGYEAIQVFSTVASRLQVIRTNSTISRGPATLYQMHDMPASTTKVEFSGDAILMSKAAEALPSQLETIRYISWSSI